VVLLPKACVDTTKVAVVPDGVTLAGSEATAGLLLDSVIVAPEGAGPLSVTMPFVLLPPSTTLGLTVTTVATAACTVSAAVWLLPS